MLLRVHPQPTGKVCVSVHGMAGHEGVWAFPDPAEPARTIEQVQLTITSGVYDAIRGVDRLAGDAAGRLFDRIE